jgi:tetratricopeptide (TPR) repeat protein
MGRRRAAFDRVCGSLCARFLSGNQWRTASVLWFGFAVLTGALCFAQFPSSANAKMADSPKRGTVSVNRLAIPDKARDQMNKAIACLNKHDTTNGLKYTNAALVIAPDFPDALTLRARFELNANRYDAALDDLEHSVKADPGYGLTYLEMAMVLNHFGRYDDALRSLDRSAELEPHSWQCAYEMARAWIGKHEYGKTLVEIDRAAALGGEEKMGTTIHFVRGYALAGLKKYEQARVELKAYLSSEPNGALAGLARETLARVQNEETVATQ